MFEPKEELCLLDTHMKTRITMYKELCLLVLLAATTHAARLPYIVGGQDIDTVGKWPWQGSIQVIGLSHFCGCIVLSKDWMLSASSCFLLPSAMSIVLLGAHDVRTRTKGDPSYHSIAEFIRHPDFDTGDHATGYPNDIGLIKLNQPANLDSLYISPAELVAADTTDNFTDAECYITGWGFTLGGIFPPNVLKEGKTSVMTNTACDAAWTAAIGPGLISDTHLCVGGSGNGACSGDSGGPVVCKSDGRWQVVAVTSWGMSTCEVIYPTVCTRVSKYRDWITDATDGDIP